MQSSQPRSAVGVGVVVISVFFALVLCAICASFTFFKLRRRERKKQQQHQFQHNTKASRQETTGFTNNALDMQEQFGGGGGGGMPLNNQVAAAAQRPQPQQAARYQPKMRTPHRPHQQQQRPDLLVGGEVAGSPYRDLVNPSPAGVGEGLFPENAEHYDIENASSIAPSDIDVVYHYKGYRDQQSGGGRHHRRSGGSKSLTGSKGRRSKQQQLNNTPLARLSPSSEMSHNPRILHLGDLSGKSLPPGLLVEQSERSLNSPVSHVSSNSRHSHRQQQHHRGLTSENVARFNSSQSPHHHHHHLAAGHKSPSLLNSMDVLQSGDGGSNRRGVNSRGSRSASRYSDRKTPLSHAGGDGASASSSSSSSDDGGDDDSFTCSEYEYDGSQQQQGGNNEAKDVSAHDASAMVFSKLASSPPPPPPPAAMAGADSTAEDDDEEETSHHPSTSPLSQGKTWEGLLSWAPSYQGLSGVFRDLAELPSSSPPTGGSLHVDACRPSPLGDHSAAAGAEEQYI